MRYDSTLSLDRQSDDFFPVSKTKVVVDTQATKITAKSAIQTEKEVLSGKAEYEVQTEKEQPADTELNNERIRKSLESLNQFIPLVNTNLVFEFDVPHVGR